MRKYGSILEAAYDIERLVKRLEGLAEFLEEESEENELSVRSLRSDAALIRHAAQHIIFYAAQDEQEQNAS